MPDRRPRVRVVSVGCRLNQAEAEGIREAFADAGYVPAEGDEPADVCVVNTCTVTARAEATSRRLLRRARRLCVPGGTVIAAGCYAELDAEAVRRSAPRVVAATMREKGDLPAVASGRMPDGDALALSAVRTGVRTRAFVKVQDGCDCACSFCRARVARGPSRSRAVSDVVSDVRSLVSDGVGEVVLTGVQVGSFRDGRTDLAGLLRALLDHTDVARVRLGSVHPGDVGDELVRLLLGESRLARQLHLPLQSGCDRVLRAMRRPYTAQEYAGTAGRVLEAVPDVCLGADVLVGFPGEGDGEFRATLDLVRSLPLSRLHVFSYSDRPDTEAFSMLPKTPPDVIAERSRIARRVRDELWRVFRRRLVGSTASVLLERPAAEGFWRGLASNYVEVRVPAEDGVRGTFADVRLLELSEKGMAGEVVPQGS